MASCCAHGKMVRYVTMRFLSPGDGNEASRVHQSYCRFSGDWPLAVKAQQPTMPLLGFLSATSESTATEQQIKFHSGLSEAGFVQGKNVTIVYHWADGQYDRLPAMAADLVRRPVSLIVAQGPPAALAARAATTTIPIVFVVGFDPIAGGLVQSLIGRAVTRRA
jgi:ABC-type uncharacterized transport system substrate-binding protein